MISTRESGHPLSAPSAPQLKESPELPALKLSAHMWEKDWVVPTAGPFGGKKIEKGGGPESGPGVENRC